MTMTMTSTTTQMNLIFELGNETDLDEMEQLYNDLIDHLIENGTNYAGWKKGIYPNRQTAMEAVAQRCLFVARHNGKIIGSIVLKHEPEPAYREVKWGIEADDAEVFVIYTFVVHPAFLKNGVGKALLDFAMEYAIKEKARAIRLDVYEDNLPAIKLYEKCGFNYIDKVDLGLGEYGLDWFDLYEKVL